MMTMNPESKWAASPVKATRGGGVPERWNRLRLPLLALCFGVAAVRAADIPVPNGSFESPAVTPPFPVVLEIDSWQKTPQPAWFDPQAFGGVTWAQTMGAFPNPAEGSPDRIANMDGAQAAYMFALPEVGLFQELSATYEVGLSYTLTVGMVSSASQVVPEGSLFELSLYYLDGASSPVTVASTPISYSSASFPSLTEFVDFSVNLGEVETGDAWAGQNIGVRLLSTFGEGGIWDLDNVRLQAIPEPATTGLLAIGLGFLSLMRYRARRRHS
ncbi:MAG: PEP-CTERM sorting domain-containing protein [Verrucomicrobia bacterium]|nr:PEP-CTERM sorting domain-containing protein [Verrucomicrobiota bacterium]